MVTTAHAQIGFQATLADTSYVVSSYVVPTYGFSAAMSPKIHPTLSPKLEFVPQPVSSSADSSSITFETTYAGDQRLVPVSVDAFTFSKYRRRKQERDKFNEITMRSLQPNQDGQKRQGINIGFSSLPKRFDQVFGEGGANLKITGYRRISFSGRSQWQDGSGSDLYRQSKFPSLNMEQISRFDITGTIGSKITVSVSQDNQTDIPLANRIQIRYKGDDDDILKTIEAGNTNLALPNTRFVGYSQQIQGLFGLKAVAQVGNFRLTAIASQEKGSTEKASISAAGEEAAQYIRDYNYETSRIYDLGLPGELNRNDKIVSLYVYEEETIERNPDAKPCLLFVDPTRPGLYTDFNETITMVELDEEQFRFYNDAEQNLHYVYFENHRTDSRARAVFMVVDRYDDDNNLLGQDTIGNVVGDTLRLKVIHGGSIYDRDHPSWNLMWRNCYSVPKNLDVTKLGLKVFKGLAGQEGTTSSLESQFSPTGASEGNYMEILGLDQYNRSNQKQPDNILDDRIAVYSEDWGLVIFPSRRPFDTDTTFTTSSAQSSKPLRERVPDLYDYESSTEKTRASQYFLQYTGQVRSSVVSLNRVNIIEGSDVVTVNGRQLQRGTDYTIQYDFGQVTLLDPEATDPNADVSIDYEYAPFLAVQKKTLLGARAEYEWSRDLKFGATVLYKSDKAQDRKPRVGQETAKMLVLDGNLDFKIYPSILTSAVNAIPGVTTESPSTMTVSAEVAQSRPNPNIDDVAYIDDFEAALDQLSLGTTRLAWQKSSLPEPLTDLRRRGKMIWYTPLSYPRKDEVYNVDVAQGDNTVQTMRLIYRPNPYFVQAVIDSTIDSISVSTIDTTYILDSLDVIIDSTYDTTFDTAYILDTIATDTTLVKSWAGIVRSFEGRIDAERAEFLEIRMRGGRQTGAQTPSGVVHFDFGRINEDVDDNGKIFSEDEITVNGVTDPAEDVGLDGQEDAKETGYDPETNPDPNDDNWYYAGDGKCPWPDNRCNELHDRLTQTGAENDPLYFEWINGTEGNRDDISTAARPDKEQLGRSPITQNSYFSFKLDLSNHPDSFKVVGSESATGGWVTYRIPIRDPNAVDEIVGTDPKWTQISHIRVWFDSEETDTTADTLEIANWYIVQSNWQDTLLVDPAVPGEPHFTVASVSTEDGTFTPPPGVDAYVDPTQNVEEAQRGLSMTYDRLRPGDTAIATRQLITSESYLGYKTMEMYVHGDPALAGNTDSMGVFFRLGRDSLNFYEYRTQEFLYADWDQRNYVKVDFAAIAALKDSVQRAVDNPVTIDTISGPYRIKGQPNLNQIKYFAVGVMNLSGDSTREASGDVWVDELRVTGVRRDIGTAARVAITGNAADLLTYGLTYQAQDPYFRGLSSATRGGSSNNLGSGRNENNLSWNLSLNLHKFLPRSWSASLPVSLSYSKATQLPLLKNGTDILLPEASRELEKSTAESKSVRVSESFNKKSKNPLFSVLLNRQSFTFSYSRSNRTSVNQPFYLGENYAISGSYDAGIAKPPAIPIFFWTKPIPFFSRVSDNKLSLYPSQWRWQGQLDRRLSISDDADARRLTSLSKTFSGNMNLTYQVFENLRTSLRYQTTRDLTDPETVNLVLDPNRFKLGLETNYQQSFTADYDPGLFRFISTKWSFNSSYRDTWERSTETRKADMSSTWSVSGQFNHIEFLSIGSKKEDGGIGATPRRGGRAATGAMNRPFYDPPLAALRYLTGWIDPVKYKYSQGFSGSLPGMIDRASVGYRFGLSRDPAVPIVEERRTPSSSESEAYDFSSGFTLLGGIATDVAFKRSISRDLERAGTRTERTSTRWPDLTIRISSFSTFPIGKALLNKFISVFQPRTGFSRDTKVDNDLDNGFLIDKTTSTSYNPLLSVNFRVFKALSLTGTYVLTTSSSLRYNKTDGSLDNESRSRKTSLSFSTRYQFSAPGGIGIPLFGNLKFTSTVSIDLNVRLNTSLVENSQRGGAFAITTDQSDITIGPNISYTFSQQIKGGLSARWQDSNDSKTNRKSHVRELQIWAEIRF
jgi:hypothetical protein